MDAAMAAAVAEPDRGELPSLSDPFAAFLSQRDLSQPSPVPSQQGSPMTAESRTEASVKRKYVQQPKLMAGCWNLFAQIPGRDDVARCMGPSKYDPTKTCHREVACNGSSTSCLNAHGRTHKEIWPDVGKGIYVAPGSRNAVIRAAMKELCPVSNDDTQKENLMRTMVSSCQAQAVIDDVEFRRFLLSLKENYVPPSRETMRKYILASPLMYKEAVQQLLDTAQGKISFTTDGWESPNDLNMLCFTAHFINDQWEKVDFVLHVCNMPEQHTNKEIREQFDIMVRMWGLEDRLGAITSDNGSEFVAFKTRLAADPEVSWSSMWDLDCQEHSQQLAVDHVTVDADVRKLVHKCHDQELRINGSSNRVRWWKELLKSAGWPKTKISQLNTTRWHSTLNLIADLCPKDPRTWDAWRALLAEFNDHWCTDKQQDRLTWSHEELTRIKELKEFLQPFKDCMIDGEHMKEATLNMTLFTYNLLLDHVSSPMVPLWLQPCAELSKGKLEKYWDLTPDLLYGATCLDPRWKLHAFLDDEDETVSRGARGTESYDSVRQKVTSVLEGYFVRPPVTTLPAPPPALLSHQSGRKKQLFHLGVRQSAQDYGANKTPRKNPKEWEMQMEEDRRAMVAARLPQELREYLREDTVEKHVEPIAWWKANHRTYPTLARAAADILAAQASSSASERLWSWGRDVVSDRKHNMGPDMLSAALLMKSWITVIKPVKC